MTKCSWFTIYLLGGEWAWTKTSIGSETPGDKYQQYRRLEKPVEVTDLCGQRQLDVLLHLVEAVDWQCRPVGQARLGVEVVGRLVLVSKPIALASAMSSLAWSALMWSYCTGLAG